MSEFSMPEIKEVKEKKSINEIAELFAADTEFKVGEKTLKVRPFSFGELPLVLALLKSIAGEWFALREKQDVKPEDYLGLIAAGGEQLLQLLAANLRISRSELDEIDADIGLEIMLAFIGTNIDFFTKRVAPMLKSKLSNTPGH